MSRKDIMSDLDRKILAGLRLDAFNDPLGRKLLQLYERGILDSWTIGQINKRVDRQLRKEAFSLIPFKQPQLHSGQLILGSDRHHQQIRAPIQYLNAGTLLAANTGSGKTTLICFWVIQIAPHVKGMWLVDLRKKEFRLLKPAFDKRGIDFVVVRSRKFKINPLQVPRDVDPVEYSSVISDILVKVLNLPPRASTLLSSSIIQLYKKYDVFGGKRKYPTLFHLFEAVRSDKTANPQARQAILDNLQALLLAFGTEMLGYYRGWPVHELAKRHIDFELTGQPEVGKDLILNYLVGAELISRISRGISNRGMDLWMGIDEGQRLFSQRKELSGHHGNSITDLAGLVRGLGTGLFISVLTPEDLSNRIPAITSTKIMGRCGSIPEYTAAGRFMGLSPDQITWCAHHMVPGMFVGQVGEGQWRYPFLFNVPKMKQLRAVTDQEVDNTLKSLEHLDVEAVEFSDWSATPRIEVQDSPPPNPQVVVLLTDSEFRLLQAVIDSPMLTSSKYVKLARISPNTLKKLRPILLQKGLIKEHIMDINSRGRSKRIWEPTQKAEQVINEYLSQQEDS